MYQKEQKNSTIFSTRKKWRFCKIMISIYKLNFQNKKKPIEFSFWYRFESDQKKEHLLNLNHMIKNFLKPWTSHQQMIYDHIFLKTIHAYLYRETFLPFYFENPNSTKSSIIYQNGALICAYNQNQKWKIKNASKQSKKCTWSLYYK